MGELWNKVWWISKYWGKDLVLKIPLIQKGTIKWSLKCQSLDRSTFSIEKWGNVEGIKARIRSVDGNWFWIEVNKLQRGSSFDVIYESVSWNIFRWLKVSNITTPINIE